MKKERRLSVGDILITNQEDTVLLTKETDRYFYYFYKSHHARIKKCRVISLISCGKLRII